MLIRTRIEELERQILSPYASHAATSKGRLRHDPPCSVRTCYQRDIDRIVHSKSFRRLRHKTQVFFRPEGDHYRTRMTHTVEVARIARTLARGLRLNEDLTEAIAFGHDLGHTPYGHAGEKALNEVLDGGFRHNEQSLRVVDILEKNGQGLNLTYEVRQGILCHTGDQIAETLESRIIRYADRIAYINHDIDDAIRAGILVDADIPAEIAQVLGQTYSNRINTLVEDLIFESMDRAEIKQSPPVKQAMDALRDFMFAQVYRTPMAIEEETRILAFLQRLFAYYITYIDRLPFGYRTLAEAEGAPRAICDYIAGMTDQYAVEKYEDAFIPKSWSVK